MKKTNILTKITSAAISAVMIGTMAVSTVNAEESKKIYKFSELLPMSKEEFVYLDKNADRWYEIIDNYVCKDSEAIQAGKLPYEYDYMKISSIGIAYDDTLIFDSDEKLINEFGTLENAMKYKKVCYRALETEKKLLTYLDVPEIKFQTPLYYNRTDLPLAENYYGQFMVFINYRNESLFDPNLQNYAVNDENILLAAKLNYCVNQFYHVAYDAAGTDFNSHDPDFASVNGDDKFDIIDAAHIAKYVAKRQTEDLPSAADFNRDGKIDILDAAGIARFMACKMGAKLMGWIK